jgi:ribosomal protein L40E
VPGCYNPAHLVLGTIGDNNRDARERGQHVSGFAIAYARRVAKHGTVCLRCGADDWYEFNNGRTNAKWCRPCRNARLQARRRDQHLEVR